MSWQQDVAFRCGHVKAETPAGRPGGDAERAAGDSGLQMDTWGLRSPDSEPPQDREARRRLRTAQYWCVNPDRRREEQGEARQCGTDGGT